MPQARLYAANGTVQSSRWVTGGSFFRVKNVTLGYNLPADLVKKGYLQSARIYVSAQNLATITNYDGYDPEVNTAAFWCSPTTCSATTSTPRRWPRPSWRVST